MTVLRPHSADDVLTLTECAHRLHAERRSVETWLRQLGLISETPWGDRVVWGAVLRALDPGSRPPPAAPEPAGGRVVTTRLRPSR